MKKFIKRFWGQYIIVGLFLCFLVYSLITVFVFQAQKYVQYNTEISELNTQIADTKKEIQKLEKLSTNHLAEMAREQIGMYKENEITYVKSNEEYN